ncbi:MAG: RICIN domain-containing protein [Spirochaetes bacterium]|jgi:hypothetical protein|nr:RICIN domain-containing protein [Spirochaetota bacterium]
MKKTKKIPPLLYPALMFFIIVMPYFSVDAQTRDIFSRFPTLQWQIDNNHRKGMNKNLIVSGLKEYGKSVDPAVIMGLRRIISDETYAKYMNFNAERFPMDGTYDKWRNIGIVIPMQKKKDAPVAPQYDITEFKYFMDGDRNLYVMFKTRARPFKYDKGSQSFLVWVNTGSWAQIRIQFKNCQNEAAFKVYDFRMPWIEGMQYGKWYPIEFRYGTGEIAEAMIPLGRIFDIQGISLPDLVTIMPEARYQAPAREYFNPMSWTNISTGYGNHGLALLMHQLSNGAAVKAADNPMINGKYARIISPVSGHAFDLFGGSKDENAPVGQWINGKTEWQKWMILPFDSEGNHLIISEHSAKCLDVSEADGTMYIVQKSFSGSDSQKWKLVPMNDGSCRIVSKKFNMAIGVEKDKILFWGARLVLGEINSDRSQEWRVR